MWLAAAAVLVLFTGCSRRELPRQKPVYVDARFCQACHGDIYKTYRETAMAKSLLRLRPEKNPEDFTPKNVFYHRASDSYFTMSQRSGRYFQRRHQIDFEGGETNITEKEVHFVIGSGRHARTFVHESEGTWFELPLAWYSENGGRWAMNPGYDRPDHEGFRRRLLRRRAGFPRPSPGGDRLPALSRTRRRAHPHPLRQAQRRYPVWRAGTHAARRPQR